MTSVKGDGQQQEQEISGLDMSTYFSCSLTAVLQGRPLVASCRSCLNSGVLTEYSPTDGNNMSISL